MSDRVLRHRCAARASLPVSEPWTGLGESQRQADEGDRSTLVLWTAAELRLADRLKIRFKTCLYGSPGFMGLQSAPFCRRGSGGGSLTCLWGRGRRRRRGRGSGLL